MIRIPGYFIGFGSKVDGSASLRFSTNEVSAEDFSTLKENLNAFGWIVFQENSLSDDDIPKEDAPSDEIKSQATRIRNVLYRLWEKNGKVGDSETHYRMQTEKIINHLKEKLE